MRAVVATSLSLLIGSSGSGFANSRGWDASPHPGEAKNPAIGCSVGTNDDYWTCLAVRCEGGGELGLYYEYSDGGTNNPFSVEIDGEKFPVRPEASGEGVAFPTRLVGDVPSIVGRLKAGKQVKLVDMTPPLNRGFDTIPLRGSSRAISAVEAACAPAGGVQASAGELLRDASGRVSIGNLNNSKDCAFAKTTGTVEEVSRGGPDGTIDGVSYADDRFGSGFANVDDLKAGPDLQARRATLDYLLTPGRRLSIEVRGCGAAGRIEKLVSATEIK